MGDPNKLQVRVEIDDSQGEAAVKRLNTSVGSIGESAVRSSSQATSSLDNITQAALRAEKQSQSTRRALDGYYAAVEAGERRIGPRSNGFSKPAPTQAQLDALIAKERDQRDREFQRTAGQQDTARRIDQKLQANSPEALALAEQEKAQRRVTSIIQQGQVAQLSGGEKLELQRKQALSSYGKTDQLVQQINGHFDQLVRSDKLESFAANVRQYMVSPTYAAAGVLEGFVAKLGSIGLVAAGAVIGVGLLAYGAFKLAGNVAEAAREFENVSARTGLTTSEVQQFTGVAELAGINAGAFTTSMRTLSKAFGENSDEGRKAKLTLKEIGIEGGSAIGGVRPLGELLPEIFQKLEKVNSSFERDRILIQLFGRSGLEFAPLIGNIDRFSEAVKRSGVIIDKDGIQQAREYEENLSKLSLAWKATVNALAVPVVGALNFTVNGVKGGLDALNDEGSLRPSVIKQHLEDARQQASKKLNDSRNQGIRDEQKQIDLSSNKLIEGINRDAGILDARVKRLQQELSDQRTLLDHGEDKIRQSLPGSPERSKAVDEQKRLAAETIKAEKAVEDAQISAAEPRRLSQALKRAQDQVLSAQQAEIGGIGRILVERDKLVDSLTTEIGQRGEVRHLSLNQATQDAIALETQIRISSELLKERVELVRTQAALGDQQIEIAKSTAQTNFELQNKNLDLLGAQELKSRSGLEEDRLRLHKEFIAKTLGLDVKLIEDRRDRELAESNRQFGLNTRGVGGDALVQATQNQQARVSAIQEKAANELHDKRLRASSETVALELSDETARTLVTQAAEDDRRKVSRETIDLTAQAERRSLEASKQQQLDNLQLQSSKNLQVQLGLEKSKLAIERNFDTQVQQLDQQAIAQRRVNELQDFTKSANDRKLNAEDTAKGIAEINKKYDQDVINSSAGAVIKASEDIRRNQIEQRRTLIDADKSLFDGVKSETNSLLDQIFNRGKRGIGEIFGTAIKNAALNAFKDIASSQVAKQVTQLITGDKVTLKPGPGILGRAGIATQPVFELRALKIERDGGIGDVKLDGNGSVPVVIMNAPGTDKNSAGRALGSRVSNVITQIFGGGGAAASPRTSVSSSISFPSGDDGPAAAADQGGSGGGSFSGATRLALQAFGTGVGGFGFGASGIGPGGTSGFAGPLGTSLPSSGASGGGLASQASGAVSGGLNKLKDLFGFGSGPGGTYGSGNYGSGIGGALKSIGTSTGAAAIGAGLVTTSLASKPSAAGAAKSAIGGGLVGAKYASQLGLSTGGGAAVGVGAGLLVDGLHRGGKLGVLEDAGGGALIGFQYGGPVGAAVGAAVGAVAGTIRLFIGTDVEQMQDKVKKQYGLTISKSFAQQLIDLAKQTYGGQFDLALRSSEAQNLLSLYAQSTGQNFGLVNKARPAYLVQTGGNLYQAASYENGQKIGYQSSLQSLTSFDKVIGPTQFGQTGTLGVQQPLNVSVSLDGKSSAAFLQGQSVSAISSNPRVVTDATQDSYQGSYGRRQAAALFQQPGTVLQ